MGHDSGKTKEDRQFEVLDARLVDIQEKLKRFRIATKQEFGIVNEKLDGMAQQFANLMLMKEEVTIIHKLVADSAGGADGSVLTAIENLNGKVDEFMATQEERLRAVKGKLDAIQTGVDTIQQQLADLKANNPELEDEIAAIEATAAAIDTDVNPAAPDTGGGTTGGGTV